MTLCRRFLYSLCNYPVFTVAQAPTVPAEVSCKGAPQVNNLRYTAIC
ncbi:MAG: hypothetical protein QOF72_1840 [Blastocatellia bacterium]|nr:hypothetical protein [Blastocatellia bacterium]